MNNIFERFDIQLRAKGQGNYSAFAYLVIFDKLTNSYVKMEQYKRAYQQFSSVKEAVDYCEKHLSDKVVD